MMREGPPACIRGGRGPCPTCRKAHECGWAKKVLRPKNDLMIVGILNGEIMCPKTAG